MLVADVVPVEVGDERGPVGLVSTRSVQRELNVNTVVRFCGGVCCLRLHLHLLSELDGALETDGESIVPVAVDGVKRLGLYLFLVLKADHSTMPMNTASATASQSRDVTI